MSDNNTIRISLLFIRFYFLLTIPDKVSVHGLPQGHFDIDKKFEDIIKQSGFTFPNFSSMTGSSIIASPLTIEDDPSKTVIKTGNWTSSKKTVVTKDGQVVYKSENSDSGVLDGGLTPENSDHNYPFKFNFNGLITERIVTSEEPTQKTNPTIVTSAPIVESTPIVTSTTIVTDKPIVTNTPVVRIPTGDCEKSITTVNGVPACSESLIFDSNFKNNIDKYWTNEIHFNEDDSEFVVFDNISVNVYCKSNSLNIRPTLLDDYYGEKYTLTESLDLTTRCTTRDDELCKKDHHPSTILPPVMSARLTTKESFSFKYGVVEIKAKLPRGNWVIPEIWLHPKAYKPYGARNSGRVVLAKSIGNSDLNYDGFSIGNNLLTAGLQVNDKTRIFRKRRHGELWSDQFHVYRLDWTTNGMKFSVDGENFGEWFGNRYAPLLQAHGLSQGYGPVSPFDQEFYLLLGVHVGGYLDIPNGAVSGDQTKPWSNTDPKRLIRFYNDVKNWYGSWNDDTKLQVDYIRVWSL